MTTYEEQQVAIDPAIASACYALAELVRDAGYNTFEPIIAHGELTHVFCDGELYTVRPIVWDVLKEVGR